mgnify:CR=1 FL=1
MINYWRYSATGNDFVIFDGRESDFYLKFSKEKIAHICEEHKTDGVLFLETSREYDFHMRYLNADGGEVEMCGNGARSITHFASDILNIESKEKGLYTFSTYSGVYNSKPEKNYPLKMTEVFDEGAISIKDLYPASSLSYYINTGVPHCLFEVDDPQAINLSEVGPKVRFDKRFEKGSNCNFFSHRKNKITMRTFERGVEAETLSCGTGAVAVVIALVKNKGLSGDFDVSVPGGKLFISCDSDCQNVWLAGAVEVTDQGTLTL